MQSLHVALSITRFLEFTATGTGSGWQSDWIQQYFIRIFDATVWILYPLRWTFWTSWYILHGQCILATSQQEGVWKYMDIPGVLWLCLDWNACCILLWNLYPNSWLMCWDLFSPSLAYGRGTNRCFWYFLEDCMMPSCLEWCRWRLRTFSWRTTFFENVFVDVDSENDVFGNRLEFVLPRMMYLLDNNNFQTALYFNWFCMSTFWTWLRWFLWRTFIFLDWHFCNATGRCICNMCKCMSLGCLCFSWNLEYDTLEVKCTLHALIGSSMLHDRIKEKQGQHCTVADRARTSYLCLFCVLREKGESEVKWEFVGFWLACVGKFIHRHRRLGSDPNA